MLVKEISGLLLLGFIVWVFLAPNPDVRIDRACAPVQWGGNVVTSLAALSTPELELQVQTGMNKMTYGCEYSIWRLFYQADYNKYLIAKAAAQAKAVGAARSAAPTESAVPTQSAALARP
ncbi:hypothetical protein A6M27_17035 [Acidithiobacillus thiooxidans]|uniref:Uncharacterized protein n=1 Tax=Acidithiobacillus thiooxidans TaxID=930 RepID=A0A1C2HWN5_ACITH|nr:hypothetical protein [Acidithiobacillus thiooxidans]OCX68141.1 hypothetical protein A6O24_20070 [Acidithiobacillus thiooxidans]OCX68699.1 hypothetical protein A6P07_17745 [Acidithiobacillus thiooxidans]OCX81039.1 hypothetical protein A6O26_13685 [Acidithiobacillus thiooxidans]OCX83799.1 hypothetical protein A6M27_17035 [Acidithiobacillus thiooxidans]OFC50285.1 hypothetical protein BAE47_03020 [Acidithiobacillus thiooxidans]